jgi:hypothetical protein
MTLAARMRAGQERLQRAWASSTVRLVVLTLYYVAIIVGLAELHGSRQYNPPPFIYQEF